MLMTNTGIAMMDSGGGEGRHWQQNRKHDPKRQPEVSLEIPERPCKSDEVDITVSLYHYLPRILELDTLCREFNILPVNDWDADIYGVSTDGATWIADHGFTVGNSWNTYNGESNLSQVLQGTELKRDGLDEGDYVLLQVHGGADVRGGYTDAKLFKYKEYQSYIDACPRVIATLMKGDGRTVDLEMKDSGYGFVAESDSEPVMIEEGDIIEASL